MAIPLNKRSKKNRSEYGQLRNQIFRNTLLMIAGAFIIIILLRNIVYGHFANWIVNLLDRFIYHDYEAALDLYTRVFRNYMDLYLLAAIIITFIVILRIYLNYFTRYFNEINRGIDELMKESPSDIIFSPELAATEKKINSIKHTLERRKQDALIAEQRKNDLIVYLAHDLKTPLTSVIGYLNLLRDEPQISTELRAKYMDIALDKAERLEDLINEFFDITRFNLTTLVLEPEQTNLSRMLEQMTNEFDPILAEKELSWETKIDPDVELLCDRDKMGRVFDNLIRNAVNYSYSQTTIRLTMKADDPFIEIRIKNHGKTIPPEKLSHIFEQFYRVDSSRTTTNGGAGLGLAISKEIIELHGGTIQAKSENESTVFIVTLPTDRKKIV